MPGHPTLHIQPRPPARSPLHRLGKNAVNFAWVGFSLFHRARLIRQKGLIQPISMWPDFTGDKAIRPPQQLQVIVVENMRLALKVEL
mgnify:CR=1 FL=1